MMNWIKNNKLLLLKGLIAFMQFVASVLLAVLLVKVDLLPIRYLAIIITVLVLLMGATAALIFFPTKNRKALSKRKLAGMIVSCVLSFALMIASIAVDRLGTTINNISGKDSQNKVVAVYVRADDKANTITDARDYSFEIDSQFDPENAQKAREAIEAELGAQIKASEAEFTMRMVSDLLKEETDAIIMNAAYIDVISEFSKYSDVESKVKAIYEYEIEEVVEEETETESGKVPITERPFIIYLSGSDTRNTKLSTSRSDVNLLAVINPKTKQVLLLNTPRDYYVLISKDNFTEYDKLTHCGTYGIDCSLDTLGNLYGVEIEYYAQINFQGFSKLVDSIGGITVDSDRSFVSEDGFSYSKGTNYLTGETALSFVRERHAFADGDIQRGKDQMKALVAIIDKVKSSPSILANYSEILGGLEGMFETNLSSSEISELIKMQIDEGGDWNIVKYGVMGKGAKRTTYTVPNKRAYVMLQNEEDNEKAKALIKQVFDGETLTEVE
ncbi:MAG: LCP family protein [Agathobacter sp.]|nr:LCP family protein [Agathobacter sp.]